MTSHRHGRQGYKGGRNYGGGGNIYRSERRMGRTARDFEDSYSGRGGWNWDTDGRGHRGERRMMGGDGDVWEVNQDEMKAMLPKGSDDYWEYRDIVGEDDELMEEMESKRPRLDIDDGFLPGCETTTCIVPVPKNPIKLEEEQKPKPLLDSAMFDEYYEYFDGGPSIPLNIVQHTFDKPDGFGSGKRPEPLWGSDVRSFEPNEKWSAYRINRGESRYLEGPGPKSTDLVKIGHDNRRVSPEERLFVFVQILLKISFNKAPVQVLEAAKSKMNKKQVLTLMYDVSPEEDDAASYTCKFFAAGFYISTAEAASKEDAKNLAAENAIYKFMTSSLDQICPNNYHVKMDDPPSDSKQKSKDMSKEESKKESSKEEGSKEEETKEESKEEPKDEGEEDSNKNEPMEVAKEEADEESKPEESRDESTEGSKEDTEGDSNKRKRKASEMEDSAQDKEEKGKRYRDSRKRSRTDEKDSKKKTPSWRSPKLIIRLEVVKKLLTGTVECNCYYDLEAAAFTAEAAITIIVYKKSNIVSESEPIKCELYVDEMYLGFGNGDNFEEAFLEVFRASRENIMRIPVQSLLMNNKRLSELDREDPAIIDIIHRGHYQEIGTNKYNLIQCGRYPTDSSKTLDDLIIFDFESIGRSTLPFRNLKTSFTMSVIFVEWVFSTKDDHSPCRCQLYIQGKRLVDVKGKNIFQAKKEAADAIFKQYGCTNSVIQCAPMDFSEPTISLENLTIQAKELCGQPDILGDELTPFIHQVLEKLMDEKLAEDSLEPVIFGSDVKGKIRDFIKTYADSKNYAWTERPGETKRNMLVQRRLYTAQEMVEIIAANNCQSGKFKLIQRRVGDVLTKYWNEERTERLEEPEEINIPELLLEEKNKETKGNEVSKEEKARDEEKME